MKRTYQLVTYIGILALILSACQQNEYAPRKESVPVIEAAALSPAAFTFGDSVTLTATVKDPLVKLATLAYEVVVGGKALVSGVVPLVGNEHVVKQTIYIPFVSGQTDNAAVQVNLVAQNRLRDYSSKQLSGITGKRPAYEQLYLVTDEGTVAVLKPKGDARFEATDLTLDVSFRFRIAEKLNADNSIDYTGDVYGNVNGQLALITASGESAFVHTSAADYTKTVVFDNLAFRLSTTGSASGEDDIALSAFAATEAGGEVLRSLKRTLQKGKTYSVVGKLADGQNTYNLDFFERVAPDKVKFLGETGEYTLYFNPVRKNIFVGVEQPAFPNYLLVCGTGVGYPTRVASADIAAIYAGRQRTHTGWGFGHVLQYVLMPRVADGIYQGTFCTPADADRKASFKPFENTGWGNEKKAEMFTFTGEKIVSGTNNWDITPEAVTQAGVYRFTINLNTNVVNVEKITL